MDNAGYIGLTRQAGLLKELQTVANNVANISTAGYRREGVVFSEYIRHAGRGAPSISFADANGRLTDPAQGALSKTGGTFDFAIEGDGFFQVETPDGLRLTRAGAFTPNAQGELVSTDGHRLLDIGGAPIFIPPNAENPVLSSDGTLSVKGIPVGRVGIVSPVDPSALRRAGGVLFKADGGTTPVRSPRISQGFLEDSNVNPVTEMARLIEVQRSYELGQKFLDREDQRIRLVVRTLGS